MHFLFHLLLSNFVIFQRGEIVSGLYEPTDLECEWESDDEKEEKLSADMKNKVKIEEEDRDEKQENE
jgi:nucleosome assembly protein 1-like 1